jgi:DNA-directed RNA polymerase specialized sigma24 family protein
MKSRKLAVPSVSVGIEFRPLPVENLRDMSDEELLELCLSSKATQAAWQECVCRIQKTIRGPIYRVLSRSKVATKNNIGEVAQQTLLKLVADDCRRLRSFTFRHEKAFRAWVSVVAASLAYSFVRDIKPEDPLTEVDPPDPRPGPVKTILLEEMFEDLRKNAPEFDCDIFWLHHVPGYSAREISEMPGIKLGIKEVEYILWRLMQILRDKYGSPSKDCN